MAWLKRILIVAVFLLTCFFVIFFSLRNTLLVDIDLFFVQFTAVPIESVVVSSFILGGLAGVLASLALLYRMRKKYRQAMRRATLPVVPASR